MSYSYSLSLIKGGIIKTNDLDHLPIRSTCPACKFTMKSIYDNIYSLSKHLHLYHKEELSKDAIEEILDAIRLLVKVGVKK